MTKIQTPEQFAALGQANLESLMSLAGSAIARAERLAELNLNTVRSVLEDSMATTKKLAEAKNPQDLASLQTELTKPLIDKAVAYARSVQEIAMAAAMRLQAGQQRANTAYAFDVKPRWPLDAITASAA